MSARAEALRPADIRRAVERHDYLRRSKFAWSGEAGHKEWWHFAIHGDGVDVLANFSLVDDVRRGVRAGTEHARIVCLIVERSAEGGRRERKERAWTGDVDHYRRDEVLVDGSRLSLRFGDNLARFEAGVFELAVALRHRPIRFQLRLEPLALPTEFNNIETGDGPPIHWVVVPRLLASGSVLVGERRYELRRAPAYHDHNFGSFRWGRNFAWEWGYAAPEAEREPWSVVYVRLSDRPHLADLTQSLKLWRGGRQHRLFRGHELEVRHEGLLRPRRVFKLPRVMALARPAEVTDVPKRLIVRARRGRERLDLVFESREVAQVIIPNDDDLGVTIIHEVAGQVSLEGRVGGELVTLSTPSIFEFLGD